VIACRRSEFVHRLEVVVWLARGRGSVGSHVVEDGRSALGASRRLEALSNVVWIRSLHHVLVMTRRSSDYLTIVVLSRTTGLGRSARLSHFKFKK